MIRGRHLYPWISLGDYLPYGTGLIGLGSPLGFWIQRSTPNQLIKLQWTPLAPAPWTRGNRRRKRRRNIVIPEKPELKVTTWGKGANIPVTPKLESAKDSSSSSDSQSEGDSGLGSNLSNLPCRGTDTEPRWGIPLRSSPDATREPTEDVGDTPLSDQGEGDGDQEMPNANEPQGDVHPTGSGPDPALVPDEALEEAQLGDDQGEAGDDEEPQEPKEPLEPGQIVLQGFQTIFQTLSAAYGAASAKIQIIVRKSLAKTTAEDRTFIWGASRTIRQWIDSIRPAMAC